MRRYTITVPVCHNDGTYRQDYTARAEQLISADFNGYTRTASAGFWQGKSEPVMVYTIDTGSTFSDQLINRIAETLREYCEQEAVYVTRQGIDTLLIGADNA
jgi:hypothetical protein